jgi:uncharacterized delta-60 repeat protein
MLQRKPRGRVAIESLDRRLLMASGDLDQAFNNGEAVVDGLDGAFVFGERVRLAGDGRTFVLTSTTIVPTAQNPNSEVRSTLSVFLANGVLDNSFSSDGRVELPVASISGNPSAFVILNDGSVIVAASLNSGDIGLLKVTSGGAIDNTFSSTGDFKPLVIPNTTDFVDDIELRPDGGYVLVGATTPNSGGGRDALVVGATAAGLFDGNFGTGGVVIVPIPSSSSGVGGGDDEFNDVEISPNGFIYATGERGEAGASGSGDKTVVVMKFSSIGSLQTGFGENGVASIIGPAANAETDQLLIVNEQQIFVSFNPGGAASSDLQLKRFNGSGVVDPNLTINIPGGGSAGTVGLSKPGGDKIVVATGSSDGTSLGIAIERYNLDGTLDATFSPDGVAGRAFIPNPADLFTPVESIAVDAVGNITILATEIGQVGGSDSSSILLRVLGADSTPGNRPNLRVFNVGASSSTIASNLPFDVFASVGNDGTAPATGFSVRFYLSTDGTVDAGDFFVGDSRVNSLATGGSSSVTSQVTLPGVFATGNYFVLAQVDINSEVNESNEADNLAASVSPINIIAGATNKPNLRFNVVNASPTTVLVGVPFTVFADVANNGTLASSSTDVRFFLSPTGTSGPDNIFLGQSSVLSLVPNSSSGNISFQATLPVGTAPGSYFVVALVDTTGVVDETVETDNFIVSTSPITVEGTNNNPSRPDLVVLGTDFDVAALPAGSNISVARVFIANQGNSFAPQSQVQIVLSPNSTFGDADDIVVGGSIVQGVAPASRNNQPVVVNVGLALPSNLAAGTYRVFAVADAGGVISESNESNNFRQLPKPLTIAAAGALPDLSVSAINATAQTLAPGDLFFGEGTLINLGAVTAGLTNFRVLLSTTPDLSGVTATLLDADTEQLNPGEPDSGSEFFRVPDNTLAGSYFVILQIDPDNLIAESNESNNFLATGTALITVTDPVFGNTDASIGDLNNSFGDNGIAETVIEGDTFITTAAFSTREGKLLTVGYTSATGNLVALRFNSDGSLDSTFGTGGTTRITLSDFAIATSIRPTPDGKVLIGGSVTNTDNGTTDLLLVRLQSDGTLDPSLDGDGIATFDLAGQLQATSSDDSGGALTVSPTGEIFIVANSLTETSTVAGVLKLTASGTVDSSFGTGGLAALSFSGESQLNSIGFAGRSGSVVVAGGLTDASGRVSAIAGRLTRTGQVDRSFGTNGVFVLGGIGVEEAFTSVSVDSAGAVVLGGYVLTGGTAASPTGSSALIVKLDPRGRADRKFDADGITTINVPNFAFTAINKVVAQSDGRVIASTQILNSLDSTTAVPGAAILRLTADGALDASFGTNGILVVFQPDDTSSVTTAEDGDASLSRQFDSFLAASQGVVDVNEGGSIFAIATRSSDTGGTTVQVAQVVGDGIDLVGSVSARLRSTNIVGGTRGTVTVNVANSGTLAASGTATIQLFFSDDTTLNTTDASLTPVSVRVALKAGKNRNFSVKFVFPSNLPDGTYNVLALVNSTGTITEINDRNNSAGGLSPLAIRAPFSDLSIVSSKLPATISNAKKASLSFTLRNDGNVLSRGTAVVRLLASQDGTASDDDILLGEFTVRVNLKANGQTSARISLPAAADPAAAPLGAFFINAIITPTVTPAETNAANNAFFSSTAVTFAA